MKIEDIFATVVIPAHNEESYIKSCLTAILSQDYPSSRYEVIVVNNNSTDATADIARDSGVLVIDQNEGPVGRVRNTGAKRAKGELLLFLDSDCIAPNDWISYACGRISSNSSLVLGGGYNLRSAPKALEKYWLLDSKEGSPLPNELLGGCIAIRKDVFFQNGGFDETVTSGEDSKLSEMLRSQGLQVVIERKMSVIHLGNPTDLPTFLRRQIWHSENYIRDLRTSIHDPTFLLVATFTVIAPLSIILTPWNIKAATIFGLAATTIPFLFTIKRVVRTKNWQHLKHIHKIFLLDLTYVVGRSIGLLKGLFHTAR